MNDQTRICKSSADTISYTTALITFNNVDLIRTYSIIGDDRLLYKPDLGSAKILIPQYEKKILSAVSWNTADTDYQTKFSQH